MVTGVGSPDVSLPIEGLKSGACVSIFPTMTASQPDDDVLRTGRRDRRLGWWAIALLAVALVPFVQELTAQPAIRYAETAAMVEHHSLRVDPYRRGVGVDRVERDGHLYSDKGPIQPLLATPFYSVASVVGAESASVVRVQGNLGLWWVTLWSSLVPLLVICGLGIKVAGRLFDRRRAVLASLGLCGGTLLLVYSTQLYAHVLAGALGWGAWLALSRSRTQAGPGTKWVLLAGALVGTAVATEYQLMIVGVVLAVVLIADRTWRRLAVFVAGGLPFAALLALYQRAAYGGFFTVSYSEKPEHAADPAILRLPNPVRFLEVLLGSRGLLIFSPIVAVAVWGLVRLVRHVTGEARSHAIVGLSVFAGFVLLQSSWQNPWGGEAPGPRYVIPALPFLLVGLAEVWDVAGRVRWLAIRWSVVAMALPVVAFHLVPQGAVTDAYQLMRLREDGPVVTLWTMALGPIGWLVHLATFGVVAAVVAGQVRGRRSNTADADLGAEPAGPPAAVNV